MNVSAALVANAQAAILIEPGPVAFHHLAIAAQALRGFGVAAGNPRRDPAPAQGPAQSSRVIRFVGVQLLRPFAGAAQGALDRGQRINGREQHISARISAGFPALMKS